MKRDIYRKLMNLQSDEADNLLREKFAQIDSSIRSASDNDTVYKQLEVLDQFIYKTSDLAIELLKYLLKAKSLTTKTYETDYGPYEGKDHADIVKKIIELLDHLRYYQTSQVTSIYFDLYRDGLRKPLEDRLKSLTQYNLEALRHIGYRPQLNIIEFLDSVKNKDTLYDDFFMEIAQHLVAVEAESHGMKDENTITFGYAPLPYHKDIEQIRKWLLEKLELYLQSDSTVQRKLKAIDLLSSLTNTPDRGQESDKMAALISTNTRQVIDIYDNLFNNRASRIQLPLALEVEERLIFARRNVEGKPLSTVIDKVIDTLHSNYEYSIYQTLLGSEFDFFRHTKTYEEAQAANTKKREELLDQINDLSSPVIPVLEHIAVYRGDVEEWKLNPYSGFLSQLAKTKPTIAFDLLERAYKNNQPLQKFAGDFILGFKNAGAEKQYNEAIALVVSGKTREAIRLICFSLANNDLSETDITLAIEILHRSDRFTFLQKDDLLAYIHFLAEVFIRLLSKGSSKYDELFIEMLDMYGDNFGRFEIGFMRRETDFNDVNPAIRQRLLDKLVVTGDMSYEFQELLLKLCSNAQAIVDFFILRIRFRESNTNLSRYDYDAVPYHINDNLMAAIRDDKGYAQTFQTILASFTPKWSIYNSEIAELFKRVGGYKKPLLQFVRNAKKADLRKVLYFYDGIEPIDLDVAVAVAKKTTDKEVWDSLRSRIYTTGMVSGEYGIANDHQAKHDYLEATYANSKNKNIRLFIEETLKWLKTQVAAERTRTEEELRLRKVEFEH